MQLSAYELGKEEGRFSVTALPALGKHCGQSVIKNTDLYKKRKGLHFKKLLKIKKKKTNLGAPLKKGPNLWKENYKILLRHIKEYLKM